MIMETEKELQPFHSERRFDDEGRIIYEHYEGTDLRVTTRYEYDHDWIISFEDYQSKDGTIHFQTISRYPPNGAEEITWHFDLVHNTVSHSQQFVSDTWAVWRDIEIETDGKVTTSVITNREVDGGCLEQETVNGHIRSYNFYPREQEE